MNCPVCGMELEEMRVDSVVVKGCGGLWFDRFELKKMDEQHESAGECLLLEGEGNGTPDPTRKRHCPKCGNMPLSRHFFSVKKEAEVDECPQCGGVWLDCGELAQVRRQFGSEEERRRAVSAWCGKTVEDGLKEPRAASAEEREQAEKIRTMFRFICPSTYLKGCRQQKACCGA